MNEQAIVALGQVDAAESARIDALDTRMGDAEEDISIMQGQINDINSVLDRLSAQSPGTNFMDGNENFYEYDTDNKSPFITTETKAMVILFLLGLNMVTLCVICSKWMTSNRKYSKYDNVRGYETEEKAQLNH